MLNLRKLIDLLPYYYKGADTYKNKEGKGIFERYLEIFGNYFEDHIVEDTSTITDIIDIENCDELYLNHLWEFLGQMPFAQGPHIDLEKWKIYFNGFQFNGENAADYHGKLIKTFQDSFIVSPNTDYGGKDSKEHGDDQDYAGKGQDTFEKWREACTIPTNSSTYFNPDIATVRALIKYSISLFKIRGTKQFFEILFRIYGLSCEIGEPTLEIFGDRDNVDYSGKEADYAGIHSEEHGDSQDYAGKGQDMYISQYGKSKFDVEDSILDSYTLDRFTTCTRCVTIPVKIRGHNYTSISSEFNSFKVACENIFDRFLPFNVKADIDYGFVIPQSYTISLSLWDGTKWVFLGNSKGVMDPTTQNQLYIQDGIRTNLRIKVNIIRSYDNRSDLKFLVGSEVNGKEVYGETERTSGYIINIRRAATYVIKSVNTNSNGTSTKISIPVTRISSIKYYNIGYTADTLNIDKDHPSITIELTGTVSFNGVIYPVNIRRVDTGEILKKKSEDPEDKGKFLFTTKTEGTYIFSLVDYPIRKLYITITKDPEILEVTTNPTKVTLLQKNDTVKTLLTIQGSYHQENVLALQARTSYGKILTISELESLFVTTPNYTIPENKVLTHDYAMASIPLWLNKDSESPSQDIAIAEVRFCCIKNPIRDTTQWLNIRKYQSNKNPLTGKLEIINEFTNILPNITMYDGYINEEGEIVNDPNWQHSDWVDVSKYANDSSYLGPISRLEAWLVCSPLLCYEINNKEALYNCGEFFITNRSGYFIFKAEGDTGNGKQASFLVSNGITPGVDYYLELTPSSLIYPSNGDTVSVLIIISTNLEYKQGLQLDQSSGLSFGFVLEKWEKLKDSTEETWVEKSKVTSNDSKWVVTDYSLYTKRYSLTLNKDQEGYGNFRIRSVDGSFKSKRFTVSSYTSPDEAYLYFEAINPLDSGWILPKDWGTASITNVSNSPARAKYDLLKGTPQFKIKVLNSTEELNDIALYKVENETEIFLGSYYKLGDIVSNLTSEGTYRFKTKGDKDSTINYAEIILVKNTIFKITCTPVISVLSNGFATTMVVGTCNDPNVNPKKLQIKREGDTIWHDSPYQFIGHTTGIYNFTIRGNETGEEPTTSFQILNSDDLSVNPSSLEWESGDSSSQALEIITSSENSWEVTIEDS